MRRKIFCKLKNVIFFLYFIFSLSFSLFSLPFNSKLTESEIEQLNNGQIVIKNINNSKHISLNKEINPLCDQLINSICTLNPKYLAEVIKIIPYKGNEKINEIRIYSGEKYETVKELSDALGAPVIVTPHNGSEIPQSIIREFEE